MTNNDPVVLVRPAADLAALASQINSAQAAASESLRTGVERARACGVLLREAKKACGHGGWLPWLERHCPRVGARQAQKYMRLAERWDELAAANANPGSHLAINAALAQLAAPAGDADAPAGGGASVGTDLTAADLTPPDYWRTRVPETPDELGRMLLWGESFEGLARDPDGEHVVVVHVVRSRAGHWAEPWKFWYVRGAGSRTDMCAGTTKPVPAWMVEAEVRAVVTDQAAPVDRKELAPYRLLAPWRSCSDFEWHSERHPFFDAPPFRLGPDMTDEEMKEWVAYYD